jgi:flavorubredoxin
MTADEIQERLDLMSLYEERVLRIERECAEDVEKIGPSARAVHQKRIDRVMTRYDEVVKSLAAASPGHQASPNDSMA